MSDKAQTNQDLPHPVPADDYALVREENRAANRDEKPAELAAALAEAMCNVEAVPKHGRNSHHNYDYATADDVIATAREALCDAGVALMPSVASEDWAYNDKGWARLKITIEYTLIHAESGQRWACRWRAEARDDQDKAFYKAYSQATKYFLRTTLMMTTGEPLDVEADNPPAEPYDNEAGSAPQRPPQGQPPGGPGPRPSGQVSNGSSGDYSAAQQKIANAFQALDHITLADIEAHIGKELEYATENDRDALRDLYGDIQGGALACDQIQGISKLRRCQLKCAETGDAPAWQDVIDYAIAEGYITSSDDVTADLGEWLWGSLETDQWASAVDGWAEEASLT